MDYFVIKQLLQDLESKGFGGIGSLLKKGEDDYYLLATSLDAHNEPDGENKVHGKKGSAKRKKVRKCVDRWKVYPREKYLELLSTYSVFAWSAKPKSEKQKPIKIKATKGTVEPGSDISDKDSFDVPPDLPKEIGTGKRVALPKEE